MSTEKINLSRIQVRALMATAWDEALLWVDKSNGIDMTDAEEDGPILGKAAFLDHIMPVALDESTDPLPVEPDTLKRIEAQAKMKYGGGLYDSVQIPAYEAGATAEASKSANLIEALEKIARKLKPISGPSEDYVITDIFNIADKAIKNYNS